MLGMAIREATALAATGPFPDADVADEGEEAGVADPDDDAPADDAVAEEVADGFDADVREADAPDVAADVWLAVALGAVLDELRALPDADVCAASEPGDEPFPHPLSVSATRAAQPRTERDADGIGTTLMERH